MVLVFVVVVVASRVFGSLDRCGILSVTGGASLDSVCIVDTVTDRDEIFLNFCAVVRLFKIDSRGGILYSLNFHSDLQRPYINFLNGSLTK
jgi:hypothetical protein